MSYTQTPNLGLMKPTPNSDSGTWGYHLNQNADTLDSLLSTAGGPGALFLPLAGGNVTGVTTFSAAGTGLAVTNNATIGGVITVGGTLGVTGGATFDSPVNGGGVVNAHANPWGNWNNGGVGSFIGNNPGGGAGWSGFGDPPTGLGIVHGVDNGALYCEMTSLPPLAVVSNVSFNTTQLIMPGGSPLSPAVVAQLRKGQFIETSHSPTFIGQISAVDPTGATVTVSGWFQAGNTATGQNPQTVGTPPYTANLVIATAIWSQNARVFLNANSYATHMTGDEVNLFNYKTTFTSAGLFGTLSDVPAVNGSLMTISGANFGGTGYVTNGDPAHGWLRGFVALSGSLAGFVYQASNATASSMAFVSAQAAGNVLYHIIPGNARPDLILATGGQVQLGAQSDTPSTPYIAMHSSGNSGSDVQITATGGTTGVNDGTLSIASAMLSLAGSLQVKTPVTSAQWQTQGAGIGWNSASNGRTNFVNSRGVGVGGFTWSDTASSVGATPTLLATLDVTGALALAGGLTTSPLINAANDAAAASAGVGVNQYYRNGSIVMQRVA
jgi:hypothetical protein